MKVVLDTNVVVSALVSPHGSPAAVLAAWRGDRIEGLTSSATLAELARVLERPRIAGQLGWGERARSRFLAELAASSRSIEPDLTVTAITADPSDNMFLELAVAGAADYIVSGDAHLTSLGSYEGIPILTPAQFLAVLDLEGPPSSRV